jgi:hypothetical protein
LRQHELYYKLVPGSKKGCLKYRFYVNNIRLLFNKRKLTCKCKGVYRHRTITEEEAPSAFDRVD